MEEQCKCELCGSTYMIQKVVAHVDRDDDDTVHNEAYVCFYCFTRYPNNLEIMIAIIDRRLREALGEECDDDDAEELAF